MTLKYFIKVSPFRGGHGVQRERQHIDGAAIHTERREISAQCRSHSSFIQKASFFFIDSSAGVVTSDSAVAASEKEEILSFLSIGSL